MKPAGEREIDLRLTLKPAPAKTNSSKKQKRPAKEMPNTSRKTPPRANLVEVADEPTPVPDQDLRSKITARSEDSEEPMVMDEETHDAEDLQKDPEPTPVPIDVIKEKPVYKNKDHRTE